MTTWPPEPGDVVNTGEVVLAVDSTVKNTGNEISGTEKIELHYVLLRDTETEENRLIEFVPKLQKGSHAIILGATKSTRPKVVWPPEGFFDRKPP